MNISVSARHFELTPDVKERAEFRLDKLNRFQDGLLNANVVLDLTKHRHVAEISVHGRHGDYAGHAEAGEWNAAIDQACEKLEKQIRRSSDRHHSSHRNGPTKEELAMGQPHVEAEYVTREMMTVEEAIARLDQGGEIVVFTETDTRANRAVYRRADGSVKLIEWNN